MRSNNINYLTPLPPLPDSIMAAVVKKYKTPNNLNKKELITLPDIPVVNSVSNAVPTVTTINNNEKTNNQYMRELMLAPLSPRSPRINRLNPKVVTHSNIPTITQTCCVCYDEEIPSSSLLKCNHPVCSDCIKQLQAPECPMCKTFLQGSLVTDVVLADIMNRQEQSRLNELTSNYLAGLYMQEHPEANPEEVYERYRN